MKVYAEPVPYSSIVGGGLALYDMTGRMRFIVNLMGTTEGIDKAETEAISDFLVRAINDGELDVPERPGSAA